MRRDVARIATAVVLAAAAGLAATPAGAEKRFFTVAAVEPKGGASVQQEPFPGEPLPAGGGYVMRQPDANGRWEVSAYVWQPSQIIVNQGDEVTIEFVGINGASHPTIISGYEKAFQLKRGQVIRISFVANKPGVFPIVCTTHAPSMRGELIVQARAQRERAGRGKSGQR